MVWCLQLIIQAEEKYVFSTRNIRFLKIFLTKIKQKVLDRSLKREYNYSYSVDEKLLLVGGVVLRTQNQIHQIFSLDKFFELCYNK